MRTLNLGPLSRSREFRAIKTPEQKAAEAAENQKLIKEWLEAGNIIKVKHGPELPPSRYSPANGFTRQ